MSLLDDAQLYRALLARDSRFDGMFFVGVTSTGIYCRPICPAPNPRQERCRFFSHAAAAERRGFRPCLRCRPELAPGAPARPADAEGVNASVDAVERLARTAAGRGGAGGTDRGESAGGWVTLSLAYRPPFDWQAMLAHLAPRATPGIEMVTTDGRYARTVRIGGHAGIVLVGAGEGSSAAALRLELSSELLPAIVPLIAGLRRLLDLDAEPHAIAAHLARDPLLAPLVASRPRLRVPGALDGFELALRTVLGQQVSVRGATTLAGRLASLVAEPFPGAAPAGLSLMPLAADRLADASVASLAGIGLTGARAVCVAALARAVARGELPELSGQAPQGGLAGFRRRFTALPGIGDWTAEYVAMRALRWPDAFPAGDLVLRRRMGGLSAARLRLVAERWRPWRAYAAQQLWASA